LSSSKSSQIVNENTEIAFIIPKLPKTGTVPKPPIEYYSDFWVDCWGIIQHSIVRLASHIEEANKLTVSWHTAIKNKGESPIISTSIYTVIAILHFNDEGITPDYAVLSNGIGLIEKIATEDSPLQKNAVLFNMVNATKELITIRKGSLTLFKNPSTENGKLITDTTTEIAKIDYFDDDQQQTATETLTADEIGNIYFADGLPTENENEIEANTTVAIIVPSKPIIEYSKTNDDNGLSYRTAKVSESVLSASNCSPTIEWKSELSSSQIVNLFSVVATIHFNDEGITPDFEVTAGGSTATVNVLIERCVPNNTILSPNLTLFNSFDIEFTTNVDS
jgi:hypothetical protein